jgi:hypothetical protein
VDLSPFLKILAEPAWQGVGALIAFTALAFPVFELRKRRLKSNRRHISDDDEPTLGNQTENGQDIKYYHMRDAETERKYYNELAYQIDNARERIYRLGRGFYYDNRSPFFDQIIQAEERALQRGIKITRIQVDSPVSPIWATGYANLLERYPDRLRIVVSLNAISLNDICLIDPHGHHPVVNFLFEAKQDERLGQVGRPVTAMFLMSASNLAQNLAAELDEQVKKLTELTPDGVRDLSRVYLYFGWGVHMYSQKMLRDVPGAYPLGTARLRGWQRNIVGILSGPADRATIKNTGNDNDSFAGVAYELSWWGKARLDRLERRAYSEVSVRVQVNGTIREAFTYVPLPRATARNFSPGSWIDDVIEGAIENNITDLLTELGNAGLPIDGSQRNIL